MTNRPFKTASSKPRGQIKVRVLVDCVVTMLNTHFVNFSCLFNLKVLWDVQSVWLCEHSVRWPQSGEKLRFVAIGGKVARLKDFVAKSTSLRETMRCTVNCSCVFYVLCCWHWIFQIWTWRRVCPILPLVSTLQHHIAVIFVPALRVTAKWRYLATRHNSSQLRNISTDCGE